MFLPRTQQARAGGSGHRQGDWIAWLDLSIGTYRRGVVQTPKLLKPKRRSTSMQRTKNARKALHNSVGDIRDHALGMSDGVREVGEAVKNVLIEKFTDMLRRAVSLGERGKEAVRDKAEEIREDVRDKAEEVRDSLEEKIQERPYKSVMIAAGIGLLLGLVLHRR